MRAYINFSDVQGPGLHSNSTYALCVLIYQVVAQVSSLQRSSVTHARLWDIGNIQELQLPLRQGSSSSLPPHLTFFFYEEETQPINITN